MKHVREPGGRHRDADPGRHRGDLRPRYGRIAILFSSVTVTAVAVLGGFGMLPTGGGAQLASASANDVVPEPGDRSPAVSRGESTDDQVSDGASPADAPVAGRRAGPGVQDARRR